MVLHILVYVLFGSRAHSSVDATTLDAEPAGALAAAALNATRGRRGLAFF